VNRIIAFCGHARAGKTTAAKVVARRTYESGFVPRQSGFADPIRAAIHNLGVRREQDMDLYRLLGQTLGSLLRDPESRPGVTGPDYWVRRMDEYYRELQEEDENFRLVIDDVRFPNEVKWVGDNQGLLVYVDSARRLGLVERSGWRKDVSEDMAWDYDSGKSLEYPNLIITNNGTQHEFEEKVLSICS